MKDLKLTPLGEMVLLLVQGIGLAVAIVACILAAAVIP